MAKIFLCLLLAGLCAAWTTPVALFKGSEEMNVEDIYVDQKTGITHMVCISSKHLEILKYVQIYSNDTLGPTASFTIPAKYDLIGARITGENNGQNIMIMMNGQRQGSYYDVYYVETLDGAATWSKVIQVPRENLKDKNVRHCHSILFVAPTKRYFIFYSIYEKDEIAYVTRASGSQIFSNEKLIFHQKEWLNNVQATYTMEGNTPVIHVFWYEHPSGKNIVYEVTTMDNGNNWTPKKQVTTENADNYVVYAIGNNPELSDQLVVTYKKIDNNTPLRMTHTNDNGKTWSPGMDFTAGPQIFKSSSSRTNFLALGGDKSKPLLAALSKTKANDLEYSIWDLNTMKVIKRPGHPFGNMKKLGEVLLVCKLPYEAIAVAEAVDSYNDQVTLISRDRFSEGEQQ